MERIYQPPVGVVRSREDLIRLTQIRFGQASMTGRYYVICDIPDDSQSRISMEQELKPLRKRFGNS